MNQFNRVVVTLLLLALIPIVTAGLIVPHEAIQLLRDGLDQFEHQWDPAASTEQLLIGVGLALLIDVFLVLALYLQVRRPAVHAVPMQQVKGGQAQVAIDSVVDRLEYHIDRLPGVLEVEPKIAARRRGVEVTLEVETAAEVSMPTKIEEISAVARRVIEDEMGLKLKGKPKINLRMVAYPERPEFDRVEEPDFVTPDVGIGAEEPVPVEVESLDLFDVDDSTAADVEE
jgi:hypothetical protein